MGLYCFRVPFLLYIITMNSVVIVLPILTVLMFELGLNLKIDDFTLLVKRPKAIFVALFGQIILLPLVAFGLCHLFHLSPIFAVGMMLIACCPGGSSSNVFSMLAKGDVALSVSLTALSSIITIFTLPIIMSFATDYFAFQSTEQISLPIGNLLKQNLLLMFLPIIIGIILNYKCNNVAQKIEKVLSKLAFPCLMLLAGIFFVEQYSTIINNILTLGSCILCLLLACIFVAFLIAKIFRLNKKEERTTLIEVGMQNAAQAIAIASSPFIMNNSKIAIPAILYALLMNVVLLSYVAIIKKKKEN